MVGNKSETVKSRSLEFRCYKPNYRRVRVFPIKIDIDVKDGRVYSLKQKIYIHIIAKRITKLLTRLFA